MPTVETELTSEEVHTIWSRFALSCSKLKATGDYPEHDRDMGTIEKLLKLKFDLEYAEGKWHVTKK